MPYDLLLHRFRMRPLAQGKAHRLELQIGRGHTRRKVAKARVDGVDSAAELGGRGRDAKFIAAAFELVPQFLEALTELVDVSTGPFSWDVVSHAEDGHPLNNLGMAYQKARAVIAKATGETT